MASLPVNDCGGPPAGHCYSFGPCPGSEARAEVHMRVGDKLGKPALSRQRSLPVVLSHSLTGIPLAARYSLASRML